MKVYVFQIEGKDTDGFVQYEGRLGDVELTTYNRARLVTVARVRAESEEEAWRKLSEALEEALDVADGEPELIAVEAE